MLSAASFETSRASLVTSYLSPFWPVTVVVLALALLALSEADALPEPELELPQPAIMKAKTPASSAMPSSFARLLIVRELFMLVVDFTIAPLFQVRFAHPDLREAPVPLECRKQVGIRNEVLRAHCTRHAQLARNSRHARHGRFVRSGWTRCTSATPGFTACHFPGLAGHSDFALARLRLTLQ